MDQDHDQTTTDVATEVAGVATDVSVQRDLQSNAEDAATAPFEKSDSRGTAAVLSGNFPGPTYSVDNADNEASDGSDTGR